jgi:tetratricopeptide (TPR) repeat protein
LKNPGQVLTSKKRGGLISLAIALLVVLLFLPTLKNSLIGWDDQFTIVNNPLFTKVSPGGLFRLFSRFYKYDYYPVFYGSLWLDRIFWGGNAFGFHCGNILLHAGNALLVFWLVLRCAGGSNRAVFAAGIAALLFSVHPVNVEPVAWATGRKILLAAFFSLLSFHSYLTASRATLRRKLWLSSSGLFFLLGVLSNLSAVVTPLFMLAYDLVLKKERAGQAVINKWGFWLIAALAITLKLVGRQGQPEAPRFLFWLSPEWLFTTLAYFGQNLSSLVFPLRLSARYPSTIIHSPGKTIFLFGLAALTATGAGTLKLRKKPLFLFALIWYLLGLIPTFQIVRHHIFRADRFLYLPGIGICFLFGLGVTFLKDQLKGIRGGNFALSASLLVLLLLEISLTEKRITVWRDDRSLWADALRKNPRNALAHNHLGAVLAEAGQIDEAIEHYRQALRLRPWIGATRRNLGIALARKGNLPGAIEQYRRALQIEPRSAAAHYNLAEILAGQESWPEAIYHYREAIRLNPEAAEYHGGLGRALEQKGEIAPAIQHYREVLRKYPESWVIHNELGITLFKQGKINEAVFHYRQSIRCNPGFAEAHVNLGNALIRQGKNTEAIRHYREALKIKPEFAQAHSNLGAALSDQENWEEAEQSLLKALQLKPHSAGTHNNLANLFFRQGRFSEAIRHYRRSLELEPALDEAAINLAVALIKTARYPEAVELLRERLSRNPGDTGAAVNLAWLRATCPDRRFRDGDQAVELATRANQATGNQDPVILDTLAAAWAEAGNPGKAVLTARRARERAREQGNLRLLGEIEERLRDYQAQLE